MMRPTQVGLFVSIARGAPDPPLEFLRDRAQSRPDKTAEQHYIMIMPTELTIDAEDLKSRLSELRRFL